jgi:hypothetical protein
MPETNYLRIRNPYADPAHPLTDPGPDWGTALSLTAHNWLADQRTKIEPIWNPANTVGTSALNQTYAGMPDPSFSPVMDQQPWWAGHPLTVREHAGIMSGAERARDIMDEALNAEVGGGEARMLARVRRGGRFGTPRGQSILDRPVPVYTEMSPEQQAAISNAPEPPVAAPPVPATGPLPDLPPGHLFDPVLGAQARRGATQGMSPEEFDQWGARRAAVLDQGIAGWNVPQGTVPGTMAALPNLRTLSPAEAIKIAQSEPHIIHKPDGGYVGAPVDVRTPADLASMRASFDEAVARGASGSDWYDRVNAFIKEVSGRDPVRGRQLAEEYAVFSAQSDPKSNMAFSQQATNARFRGLPIAKARTGQQAETFNDARQAQEDFLSNMQQKYADTGYIPNEPITNMSLGPKTDIYRQHMDPTAPTGTTGTNDIWHARVFGYTDPATGEPWDAALGAAQHKFLDYETMLAVDRANKANIGGRNNWTAAEIQAAPWVWAKGQSLVRRFGISPEEGLSRANETYPDAASRFTASMPHEQVPVDKSGLSAGSMTPESFHATSTWADPGGSDAQLRRFGLNSRATMSATGAWRPTPTSPLENNPVDVARPMIDFVEGSDRVVHPGTLAGLEKIAAVRNATDMQAASGATFWDRFAGSNDRTGITIDLNRGTTPREAKALAELGNKYKLTFANTGEGAGFLNFRDNQTGPRVQKELEAGLEAKIKEIVPDATVGRASHTGPFVDFKTRQFQAYAGQGRTIREMDRIFKSNPRAAPGVQRNLLEDPNIASKAQENLLRLSQSGQLGVRPDYERWLRLLAERRLSGALDWARANSYRGLPGAIAGVGLGVGTSGEDRSN